MGNLIKEDLLQEIEKYVSRLIGGLNKMYFYNLQHTKEVVAAVYDIGSAENFSKRELEVLLIAAWFHDTGFLYRYQGHEDTSKEIAWNYLKSINYPNNKIEEVLNIINATKMPQNPKSKLEKIICDADLYHLSIPDYKSRRNRLRLEWESKLGKVFSDREWCRVNLQFIRKHRFFTQYGRTILEDRKRSNIAEMEQRLQTVKSA